MHLYELKEDAMRVKKEMTAALDEQWWSDEDDSSELIDYVVLRHTPTGKWVVARRIFLGATTIL